MRAIPCPLLRGTEKKTGALDEVQIATIQERHAYVVEMEDRRKTILESIESQGKLTEELKAAILKANTKSQLEDLYLPYKPKRRTRAMIARERGLEPLAQAVLDPSLRDGSPEEMAAGFVDPEKEVADVAAALQGAKDIMAELISETPEVRASLRDTMSKEGVLASVQMDPTKQERTKFEQYYEHSEPISKAPSHRYLAMRRGEREGSYGWSFKSKTLGCWASWKTKLRFEEAVLGSFCIKSRLVRAGVVCCSRA